MSLPYWIALIILAFVLLKLIRKIRSMPKNAAPTVAPSVDYANLTIKDARRGDSISVRGAGEDFADLDFTVDRRNRYESGGESWYELSGLYRNRRIYLEYEINDEDELAITGLFTDKRYTLPEVGLTEDELVRMDEERRAHSFEFDGQKWYYDSSYEAGYFKDDAGGGEGFYAWDFNADDRKRVLTAEKWEGEPFEVMISVVVPPTDVTVYRR